MTLGQSLKLSILRQSKAALCLSHTGVQWQNKKPVSTLQNISPSTQPRKGDKKCDLEPGEERPPPPATTEETHCSCPVRGKDDNLKYGKQDKVSPEGRAVHRSTS